MIRFAVTQRLIEKGTFDVPPDIGMRWGVRGIDGRYYTNHGFGHSLLSVPFYLIGKRMGSPKFMISLLGPLATAISCSLLFLLSVRIGYSLNTAVFLSLLAGLCTQMWPESKSPFDHSLETLFSLLAVYLTYVFLHDKNRIDIFLAGISLGFAVLTRITTVLWLFPLLLMGGMVSFHRDSGRGGLIRLARSLALFLAGLAPLLLFILWNNRLRFGSFFEAGYSAWARDRAINNFSSPVYVGLIGQLFSPGKGAFVYCPLLFLCFVAARAYYHRNKPIAVLTFSATIIYIGLFAKYVAWHGDIAWGPRYLTFLMPLWILAMGSAWEEAAYRRKIFWPVITSILIGFSFLVQLTAVMVDMNLHYFRLLRLGVIQNVDTYNYPAAIYFNPRYSPLVDRFAEVGQMVGMIKQNRWLAGNSSIKLDGLTPTLDFWWWRNRSAGMPLVLVLLLITPFVFEIALCTYRIRSLLRREIAPGPTTYQN